jgi:hypothetical protein
MSEVWKFFKKDSSDGIGSCTICGKKIQFTGSTTGMLHHLRKVHGKSIDKKEKETEVTKIAKVSGKTSTQKISIFLKKETIGEVVSKLVALDGFSFNALLIVHLLDQQCPKKASSFLKTTSRLFSW